MTEQEKERSLAFEKLYAEKYSALLAHASWKLKVSGFSVNLAMICAQDAVQETFSALWASDIELTDRQPLMAWLNKVLQNKLTDLQRQEHWWREVLCRLKEQLPGTQNDVFSDSELLLCLKQRLSEKEFDLVCRIYLYQEKPADICRELGIKSSALSMRLKRVKEKIKNSI